MAARIVPIGFGATCLLIALFSTGVLQPIECEAKLENLLKRDIDGSWTVDALKKVLNSAKKRDNVKEFGIGVGELLRLIDNTKMDCSRPEEIELAIKALTDEVRGENHGLHKFRKYLLPRMFAKCIDKLTRLRDPKLRQFMDETDKKVLLQFYDSEPEDPIELKDLQMRQMESCNKASGLLKIHQIIPDEGVAIYSNYWMKLWNEIWNMCRLLLDEYSPSA